MYYRGAQAAIVVYDITNQDTFGRAKTWVKELQRQASANIVIALAGNKADLTSKRMVEYEVCTALLLIVLPISEGLDPVQSPITLANAGFARWFLS